MLMVQLLQKWTALMARRAKQISLTVKEIVNDTAVNGILQY